MSGQPNDREPEETPPPGASLPPEPTRPPAPASSATPAEKAAAAFANASLLGLGYLLLGRRRLAGLAALGSCFLLAQAVSTEAAWAETLLLVWWAAGVAHGWYLARGPETPGMAGGRRAGVLAVSTAVLLTAGSLRFDAYGIESRVREARDGGDCEALVAAQGEVTAGHRIAGAPVVAAGDKTVDACDRLDEAHAELADAARDGDVEDLERGFGMLTRVLNDGGNEKITATALDAFLGRLPTKDPCETADVARWLGDREPTRDVLDRSAGTAARTEPAALLKCGDELMDEDDWPLARKYYQRFLDGYPGHGREDDARGGVRKATRAIELADVRRLVNATTGTGSGYCADPAKYSGAPEFRKGGKSRALFLGDSGHTGKLPKSWRTEDPAEAAVVVCAGEAENGTAVETCQYENKKSAYLPHSVTFHKAKVPLKIYELRTGKRIGRHSVQIGGSSCPRVLHYKTYGIAADLGPPGDQLVSPGKSDVRDAFRPVLKR